MSPAQPYARALDEPHSAVSRAASGLRVGRHLHRASPDQASGARAYLVQCGLTGRRMAIPDSCQAFGSPLYTPHRVGDRLQDRCRNLHVAAPVRRVST
jgi:hypothetical protein